MERVLIKEWIGKFCYRNAMVSFNKGMHWKVLL